MALLTIRNPINKVDPILLRNLIPSSILLSCTRHHLEHYFPVPTVYNTLMFRHPLLMHSILTR